ncbi:MAG TPA: protein-methionine-sulfoxide reductase heme-binding subunit MsrQ [Bryobacteraceae bacterium]|nr:protein-methionine-sulfoxide reductase heme-binding subunit MsrQ [Bryobacteraceae bacterium]
MIWKSPWYPRAVFVLSLAPLVWLGWRWQHHDLTANRVEFVARFLGIWALRFLLMTLAITPLRRIPGLGGLMRIRRMLGLFTFFYGFLHALHYFALDVQWNLQLINEDLTSRRFFIAGAAAFLLLIPLALTSTDRSIRWMGGRNWRRLHRLVYLSAAIAVVHYIWQGKGLTLSALEYAAVLVLLFVVRLALAAAKRWTVRQPSRVPAGGD